MDKKAKDYNLPDDADIVVEPDYWSKGGRSLTPPIALNRNAWFDDMRNFYLGLNTEKNIRINYFRRAAEFVGNMLAAFPPKLEGAQKANRVFAECLSAMGTDLVRYGVSINLTNRVGDQRKSVQINPQNWYPLSNGETLVMTWGPYIQQGLRMIGLHYIEDGKSEFWSTDGVTLKERMGEPQYMDALDETRMELHMVQRFPLITGSGLGTSMYPDMISLVKELENRVGNVSSILDEHVNPILMLSKKPTSDVDFNPQAGELAAGGLARLNVRDIVIDEDGKRYLFLGGDYDDGKYLTWDPQMQASQSHTQMIEDALFSATSIPAAMYAADRSILATGVALRRLFLPNYTMLETLRHRILPVIADMFSTWENREVDEDDIEWINPYDIVDQQAILQGSPQDFEEDNEVPNLSLSDAKDLARAEQRRGETQ